MRVSQNGQRSPGSFTDLTVTVRDRITGSFDDVTVRSFVPDPLPDTVSLSPEVVRLSEEATHQLGTLNAEARRSPFGDRLVWPFVRLEAVSSSRIEGTASSFEDLMRFEQQTMFDEDARGRHDEAEVLAYVRALEYIWKQPRDRQITLSYIREIHQILMEPSNELITDPGRFRRRAVFIGGNTIQQATFVPPPPAMVPDLMADLETTIRHNRTIPRLAMVAMAHYQFETIHPFNDGNGRTGRLLMLLQLRNVGLLEVPALHISRAIESTRQIYIDLLTAVRNHGVWEQLIAYIVDAIAQEASRSIQEIASMTALYHAWLPVLAGSRSDLGQRAIVSIITEPVFSTSSLAARLDIQFNSAKRLINLLERAGVVRQISEGNRNRRYSAPAVLQIYDR